MRAVRLRTNYAECRFLDAFVTAFAMSKQFGDGEASGARSRSPQARAPLGRSVDPAPGELDAAALARLNDLDPTGRNGLLARVLEAFASSSERLLPQLRESARAGDLLLLRHVVHTLKSSSANVGALRLSRLCADLEAEIRQGRADSPLQASEEIATELAAVEAALQRLAAAGR